MAKHRNKLVQKKDYLQIMVPRETLSSAKQDRDTIKLMAGMMAI